MPQGTAKTSLWQKYPWVVRKACPCAVMIADGTQIECIRVVRYVSFSLKELGALKWSMLLKCSWFTMVSRRLLSGITPGAEASGYAFVNEAKVLSKSEHWAVTEGASPILKNNIAYIKALLYRGRLLGQEDGKSM